MNASDDYDEFRGGRGEKLMKGRLKMNSESRHGRSLVSYGHGCGMRGTWYEVDGCMGQKGLLISSILSQ